MEKRNRFHLIYDRYSNSDTGSLFSSSFMINSPDWSVCDSDSLSDLREIGELRGSISSIERQVRSTALQENTCHIRGRRIPTTR